jgi:hypothetical protein
MLSLSPLRFGAKCTRFPAFPILLNIRAVSDQIRIIQSCIYTQLVSRASVCVIPGHSF